MTLATDRAIVRIPARADLVINMFGRFAVTACDRPLPKTRTRKDLWLLALLTLHATDRPVERSWLATTLWPETGESGALYNLRRSLGALREALGPQAERILSPGPRTLRLNLEGAECDLLHFDDAIRSGDENSLKLAAALYQGPLLPGCAEEWVWEPRAARQRALFAVLENLADAAKAQGDHAQAIERLQQVLQQDPLRESALRSLMTLLMAQGSHAEAAELFRRFRESLQTQANAEPSLETARINQQILRAMQDSGHVTVALAVTDPTHANHSAAVAGRPGNTFLPIGRSDLVGRDTARGAVRALLKDHRLVTLVGTGGIGKTRLALAVVDSLAQEIADGVCFVDLTTVADSASLAPVIAHALGLEHSADDTVSRLSAYLALKQILILLDNCEHLTEACSRITTRLLQDCEHIRFLATSRERLWAEGEIVWRVPSLAPPDGVALFSQRARVSRPGFQPSPATSDAITQICLRLDGIPLAIEMAAAWMRAMSAPRIAERLDDAFRLLALPDSETLPRHQTLRATLDWSYNLLTGPEQTLLARLSIFAGSWTLDAAEAVCPGVNILDAADILETLVSLVDRSLVVYHEDGHGEGRYHFLETTRAYAVEKLPESDRGPLRVALCQHLTRLAETAKTAWGGADETAWLDRLEAELPNVRVALTRAGNLDEAARVSQLRLATLFFRVWWRRAHLAEGRASLTAALEDLAALEPSELIAAALNARGSLANMQRDSAEALTDLTAALTIRRLLGDKRNIAVSLHNIVAVYHHQGDLPKAIDAATECVDLYRELGDETRVMTNEKILAGLLVADGRASAGVMQFSASDLEIAIQRQDRSEQATICGALAIQALQNEQFAEALAWGTRSLAVRAADQNHVGVAESLEGVAKTCFYLGHLASFARLFGAASRLRERIQCPMIAVNRVSLDHDIAQARTQFGDSAWTEAQNEGKAMSTEDAVAFALSIDA